MNVEMYHRVWRESYMEEPIYGEKKTFLNKMSADEIIKAMGIKTCKLGHRV